MNENSFEFICLVHTGPLEEEEYKNSEQSHVAFATNWLAQWWPALRRFQIWVLVELPIILTGFSFSPKSFNDTYVLNIYDYLATVILSKKFCFTTITFLWVLCRKNLQWDRLYSEYFGFRPSVIISSVFHTPLPQPLRWAIRWISPHFKIIIHSLYLISKGPG
jgi:hypothetical protein